MHNGGTESHHELSPHDEPVMESGIAQSRGATFLYMRPCGRARGGAAPLRTRCHLGVPADRLAAVRWDAPSVLVRLVCIP